MPDTNDTMPSLAALALAMHDLHEILSGTECLADFAEDDKGVMYRYLEYYSRSVGTPKICTLHISGDKRELHLYHDSNLETGLSRPTIYALLYMCQIYDIEFHEYSRENDNSPPAERTVENKN